MNKSIACVVVIIITTVVIGVRTKTKPNSKAYWKQWDQASSPNKPLANEPGRQIAQDKKPLQCLDTQQRINFLKKKISLLDKRAPSKDKEIFNKSLSLKNLTQQESDFLKKYPKFVATLEEEVSDCKDTACFFKKVYKSSDDYEGLLIYYFYLENGYIIGTSNDLPRTSKIADYGYDKYLFSREELDFFLYSSIKLGDKFKFMSSLNSIHRLPQGLIMSLYPNSCGLNWSSKTQGDILLMDSCLRNDSGHVSVIHEIAHSLDKVLDNKLSSFSESKEWLDFGGWTIKEDKDIAGRVSRQWAFRDDSKYDEFITSYSRTNPAEDFADSISRYVTSPEELLAKSPKKFQFIKSRIFNGRAFDKASQNEWYSSKMLTSLKLEFPNIVKACLNNKDQFKSTEIEKLGLEGEILDPKLLSCFKGGMEGFLSDKLKEYAEIDIYSCEYFKSSELSLIELTVENYKETLKDSIQDNELLAQRAIFKDQLQDLVNEELEPREFVLNCYKDSKPEDCYNEKITTIIISQASTIKDFPEEVLKSFIDFYFEKNSYEATRSANIRLFRSIFDQSTVSIQKWSQETWAKCIAIQDDSSDEMILPFSAGSQYVDAKILTCLNQNIAKGVNSILAKRANKLGVLEMTKENKDFLFDLYSPIAFDRWKNLINIAAKAEYDKFIQKKPTITTEMVNKLSIDSSWLQESSKTQDEFLIDCRPRNEELLIEILNSDLDFKTLRFSTTSQTTANWSSGICESVFQSTSITKEFKKRNPPRIEVLQKRLLELTDENWIVVEKGCIDKNKKINDKKKLTNSVKSCMQLLVSWNKVISLSLSTMKIEFKVTPKEESELEAWMQPQRISSEKAAINRALENIK